MAEHDAFRVSADGGLLAISLLRPRLSVSDIAALTSAIQAQHGCAAALLYSAGEDFCVGRATGGPVLHGADEVREQLLDPILGFYGACQAARFPVVTAVHGRAHGFGFGLALCGDVVLAADDATFALPEINAGFAPLLAMTRLGPSIPDKLLMHLAVSTEAVDAATLAMCGAISKVIPRDELPRASEAYARRLAALPGAVDSKSFLAAHHADRFSGDAARARHRLGEVLGGSGGPT